MSTTIITRTELDIMLDSIVRALRDKTDLELKLADLASELRFMTEDRDKAVAKLALMKSVAHGLELTLKEYELGITRFSSTGCAPPLVLAGESIRSIP